MEKINTLSIISQAFNGKSIRQREADGYVSATDMCQAFGKEFKNYNKSQATANYISALEKRSVPFGTNLIMIITTGPNDNRGTWVHPRVAIHLAQWLSPTFSIEVTDWVLRYLAGDITLVKDVVDRHDAVHDATTTVILDTVNNDILRRERLAAVQSLEATTKETLARASRMEAETIQMQRDLIASLDGMKADAQLFSAFKNSIMNMFASPPANALPAPDDYSQSKDISQLYREIHGRVPTSGVLGKIGIAASKEWARRHPGRPIRKTQKHCNGSIRDINVYPPEDAAWLAEIIRRH